MTTEARPASLIDDPFFRDPVVGVMFISNVARTEELATALETFHRGSRNLIGVLAGVLIPVYLALFAAAILGAPFWLGLLPVAAALLLMLFDPFQIRVRRFERHLIDRGLIRRLRHRPFWIRSLKLSHDEVWEAAGLFAADDELEIWQDELATSTDDPELVEQQGASFEQRRREIAVRLSELEALAWRSAAADAVEVHP